MHHPDMIILYVTSAAESAALYAQILGVEPVQTEPNFALFALNNGLKLGVWATKEVRPESLSRAGAMEINIHVDTRHELDALYKSWSQNGVKMLQAPQDTEFGYCFTALDPDGHRVRPLCRPNA